MISLPIASQRAYTYDAVDQLTGVTNFEMPMESYLYDAVDNRPFPSQRDVRLSAVQSADEHATATYSCCRTTDGIRRLFRSPHRHHVLVNADE